MAEKVLNTYRKILDALSENPTTIDELALKTTMKRGWLLSPLEILEEQGLVKRYPDGYATTRATASVVAMLERWHSGFDATLYGAAREVAHIILTYSRPDAQVKDVLLFGSLARGDVNPNDIDMVILHDGRRLTEFEKGIYREAPVSLRVMDAPAGPDNLRRSATSILTALGSDCPPPAYASEGEAEWDKKRAVGRVTTLLGGLNLAVDETLDLHELHVGVLDPKQPWRQDDVKQNVREPSFFNTFLTEGRLYDRRTADFTTAVEEKYPGAASLFPQRNPRYARS